MIELKAKDGCCQEASMFSQEFYIPCNAPATKIMRHRNGEEYRMCDPCADHNTRRGFQEVKKEGVR